uniref:Matrix metallopeptidase 20a (enamelysin) n=1 Tax=Paramormyrops kingsleyae TaxID=1676925 RepID=A0A3B3SS12_9TELE
MGEFAELHGYLKEYLRKFYHLDVSHGLRSKRDVTAVETKIGEMQDFFGLEKSGQLDHRTLEVMRRERCGVPDAEQYSSQPNRPKWKNHTITYRIQNYTPDLTKQEVENTFRRALKIWSDVAPLKFIRVDHGEADIMINFASKGHGDFFPFDGPRGVLAHAFEPGEDIGGDVHFDEDEVWRMGRRKPGYNLFTVAAHELGHSLGLSHSKDPSALMYPSYRYSSMTQYTLPRDDALAIQALYGGEKKLTAL